MRLLSRFRQRQLLILLILVLLLIVASQSEWLGKNTRLNLASVPGWYPVASFDDGDTVVVDMNGQLETVRFIGVDTPETHHPSRPLECYGQEASVYTKQLVGASRVRLEADPLDTNRDRYGRLLRYVYLPDGRLVEEELIKNGYGFAYISFPFEKKSQFTELEKTARDNKLGLWAVCQPMMTTYGVYQSNPVGSN